MVALRRFSRDARPGRPPPSWLPAHAGTRQFKTRRPITLGLAIGMAAMAIPLFAAPADAAGVPTVTSISTSTGSTGGGTVVTITGTGFVVGATAVTFGTTTGIAVNCTSVTTCSATSPGDQA